ncbi:MAG: cadherin-like beta sandwich domain-containing protein [Nitrospira sp.]|nr:cadherin-like beta sandwich domain-containing protein [Nitrospira sp.]
MLGPTHTPSTPRLVKHPIVRRYARWRATAMKVAVLLVNGYFLLGMGDCNGGGSSSIHESIPAGPTLSALTLSAGLLNPSFDPDVTSYDTMFIGETSVTVTPTATDAGTTITVNSTPVTSGNASGAINLPSGNTTITLILTANGVSNTYTITAHRLAQQAYGKASNTGSDDRFGWSVALDGDTLAVGAITEESNATGINGNQADNSAGNSGAVYVFTRSGGTWTQQAYVKASNTGSGDLFGTSVALDGDTLAVGAQFEDSNATGINGNQADNSAGEAGAVYVFTRSGTTWTQQAYLKASNTGSGDLFGTSVALDGDTLAVVALEEDSNATGINGNQADNSAGEAGAVYVFTRSGTTWSQQAYVKASNTEAGDEFGQSVALSGDTLAVVANNEASNATGINGNQADNSAGNSGAMYVFARSGTTWTQQAYVKASNTESGDAFGFSVALDGNTLAVGAQFESSNATGINGNQANNSANNAGAVYVYQ